MEGFLKIEKPEKEKKKSLRDYFVTVEIRYEYTLRATGYKREDAINNIKEQIAKHEEEGDLWDFLLDEDCSCPNGGAEFSYNAKYIGLDGE